WRRQLAVTPETWGERTAAAFMGIRLECAQCHKHPLDRWTQADYRAYANIFSGLTFGVSPEAIKAIEDENAERKKQGQAQTKGTSVREIFCGPPKKLLTHPDTNKPLPAKALGGPEIKAEKDQDPREALFEWLRSPDNKYFARSFANRMWGHYFGIGI